MTVIQIVSGLIGGLGCVKSRAFVKNSRHKQGGCAQKQALSLSHCLWNSREGGDQACEEGGREV